MWAHDLALQQTAESKSLHLAVSSKSSHQTANKNFALGIQVPWFFIYLFIIEGRGVNMRMPHQLGACRRACSSSGVVLFPRAWKAGGFERLKYSMGNYRKVSCHVKLVFTSACSARCARTAFQIRHGLFVGIHALGVNNVWSARRLGGLEETARAFWRPARLFVFRFYNGQEQGAKSSFQPTEMWVDE